MRAPLKTPGVYINEAGSPGSTLVSLPTAVPAFIGFTALTNFEGNSVLNKPIRIHSFSEFQEKFGSEAPLIRFCLRAQEAAPVPGRAHFTSEGMHYLLDQQTIHYRLYSSIKLFYENGGADCWVVSVGGYDLSNSEIDDITPFNLAMSTLETEVRPTLLVIPDVVEMKANDAYRLQSAMIDHCGALKDRMAILDIPYGYYESPGETTSVEKFRDGLQPSKQEYLSYAAAYYPWLHATVYDASAISFSNLQSHDGTFSELRRLITAEFTEGSGEVNTEITGIAENLIAEMKKPSGPGKDASTYDGLLKTMSAAYASLMQAIAQTMNLLAPSGAIAGIYHKMDSNRGVWASPANVLVLGATGASLVVDNQTQEDLNVPLDGKSVCAIREIKGRGLMVWGARTLDGNSNDWRYVNVRRTLIWLEQSIKLAIADCVFLPNTATTWSTAQNRIAHYLTEVWKEGGLQGAIPADAFSVSVGLGTTMTVDDVEKGLMRIAVKVAVSRPAEFYMLTFEQNMNLPES